MDASRFDALLRSLAVGASRRGLLAALTSGLIPVFPFALGSEEAAGKNKKRKKKRRKNKNKPSPSASPPPPVSYTHLTLPTICSV